MLINMNVSNRQLSLMSSDLDKLKKTVAECMKGYIEFSY